MERSHSTLLRPIRRKCQMPVPTCAALLPRVLYKETTSLAVEAAVANADDSLNCP